MHSVNLDRYYIGMTTNLRRRLKQHRSGQTSSVPVSDDWMVVWSTQADTAQDARAWEKQIKGRGAARFLADRAE